MLYVRAEYASYSMYCVILLIRECHVTSSPWQQDVGDKINSKTDHGWESNFLPGTENTL